MAKKILNMFLVTLTIEAELYFVAYIKYMASTYFLRANENRDFGKKKKQK